MFSYKLILDAIEDFQTNVLNYEEDDEEFETVLIMSTTFGRKLKFSLDFNDEDYGLSFVGEDKTKKSLLCFKVSDNGLLYVNVNDIAEICVRKKQESETPSDYSFYA